MYMALGYTCVADRSFKSADQLAEPSWLLITVNVWVFQPLLCVFCWVQAALEVFQQNQRWCQNFSVLPSGCGWAESDISPAAVSKRNQSDFAQSCDLTFVFFFSPPVQHTRLTCGNKVTYILDFFFISTQTKAAEMVSLRVFLEAFVPSLLPELITMCFLRSIDASWREHLFV